MLQNSWGPPLAPLAVFVGSPSCPVRRFRVRPSSSAADNDASSASHPALDQNDDDAIAAPRPALAAVPSVRSEEHTSETPVTNAHLVCRLLLEKKNKTNNKHHATLQKQTTP